MQVIKGYITEVVQKFSHAYFWYRLHVLFFMSTILYRCLYSCNEHNKLVMHAIVLFKQKFSSALSFMPMVHGSEY